VRLSDEEILGIAQDAFMCRIVPLPVKTNRILDFARLIQQKQREIDAALCERESVTLATRDQMRGALYVAAAIRSHKP